MTKTVSTSKKPRKQQQPEIRVVEGLQSRHQRAESGISGPDRGSGVDGVG
ncbi:Uncharacterised protein [Escherichia coli]|nr:Uncharacterised protein [Escherichia coli]CAD5781902.1 Uncharacterised protein [Escherichia coli]CAD5794446.1 Uncharacterised protein [Escherichia coli]